MTDVSEVLRIPWPAFLSGTVVAAGAALWGCRRVFQGEASKVKGDDESERDWSLPAVDAFHDRRSPFHEWDPRFKIASILTYCFLVVSLRTVLMALAAAAVSVACVAAARVPLGRAFRRVAAMGGFLVMLVLVMPLTVPVKDGDMVAVVMPLDWLSFNVRGFEIALLIGLKATAVTLLMEPLLGTAPFSVTVSALARIGLPKNLCQMLLLAHPYLYVFQHEARRMSVGMAVRGFRKRTNWATLQATGNFLGMLFVRSFERTERVYEAMLCRGYRGEFPATVSFTARGSDWAKGAVFAALGAGLLLLDRMVPVQSMTAWLHFLFPFQGG
ncbi:cobalt ECF transporter T component CbiQ [Desulfoglaeba alkanexedens]|uniref:Cobalt ECF transporter T component CbiQ n=1 Tax=Desulfoglaeba alkanexedens ALDC TaxID=980445 RepID=A0A4P8L7D3_9BACT|nr:cobalt ECF transporter T component CbiQ [Desulfoglaeba alkanexedens]QCQ23085.1 cobalt ECF transporter T component CbiQ [Desulfoglaeba alkanexedens ALDC]